QCLVISAGGKARDDVEFLQEGPYQLVYVVFRTHAFELVHDAGQGGLNIRNRALRKIRSMLLKTSMMLGEFLSVKLGNWLLRADRPRVGHEAWHADPLSEK